MKPAATDTQVNPPAPSQETVTAAPSAAPPPAQPELLPIVEANTLQGKGKIPFHLAADFQMFDLEGKPSEHGTLDYWWAGDDGFFLEIKSPSLGTVHDFGGEGLRDETALRTLFFVEQLLGSFRSPAVGVPFIKGRLVKADKQFGAVTLHCSYIQQQGLVGAGKPYTLDEGGLCVDDAGTIRLLSTPSSNILRNKAGKFSGTLVALDAQINYGAVAITGHVTTLKGFTPAQAPVKLHGPSGLPSGASVRLSAGVMTNHLLHRENPIYPAAARMSHSQGSVVLYAMIDEKGSISALFPLASPDPVLTRSALDAVKHWTYAPYLLNGTPTAVKTTVTVNFNFNR